MINDFIIIFLAIVLETLPFLLAGSLIASVVTIYVDEERIRDIMPKNPVLQTIMALTIGLIFPLCECAIIPVVRGLIQKGVPVRTAVTLMLAVPLVNPIAITATLAAFPGMYHVVLLRLTLGSAIAVITGLAVSRFTASSALKSQLHPSTCQHCHPSDSHNHHGHLHIHTEHDMSLVQTLQEILKHTKNEFLDVSRFIILGAAISALFQVTMPSEMTFSKQLLPSTLFLESMGYVMSICSHADAFVASSFLGRFSLYPVLAFLIVSPLIDIKNTIVLVGNFKPKFYLLIITIIFILVFISVMTLGTINGS